MIKQVLILCNKLYLFFFLKRATAMQPFVTFLVNFGCLFSGNESGFSSVPHQGWAVYEDLLITVINVYLLLLHLHELGQ